MGSYRRRIEVASWPADGASGVARAALEDDFHHFRVEIRHAAGVVTSVCADALRHPTSICGGAVGRLDEVVGAPLSQASAAIFERTDPRQQCTHLLDLAGLAVAAAARGVARRVYEMEVVDRVEAQTRARLWRDGALVLDWAIDRSRIAAPEAYAGVKLGSGFTGWARQALDLDEAEAALALRRAAFVSGGRVTAAPSGEATAAATPRTAPLGGCWAWQPDRATELRRTPQTTFDFTDRPGALGAEDHSWMKNAG